MATQVTKTIREVALETPAATAVLESLGIDYCCGGHLSFEEACQKAGKSPEAVSEQIRSVAVNEPARKQPVADWSTRPLSELINHIISTHHVFVRAECPRLLELAGKVAEKHGGRRPELLQAREVLDSLAQELSIHLMKEEQILFPYIERLEESSLQRESAPPSSCFGSVENPIRMMISEHESAGEALRELRRLTKDYEVPADACASYRALLQGLAQLEADLHQHIHLENNILFPRALELAHCR